MRRAHSTMPAALAPLLLASLLFVQPLAAVGAFSQGGAATTARIRATKSHWQHALRHHQQHPKAAAAPSATPQTLAASRFGAAASVPGDAATDAIRVRHTPFNSEASLQIAARQRLFDYAVQQGLAILDAKLREIQIPAVNTVIDIPLIGGMDVSISDVNITTLAVPKDRTKVTIESGYYHLQAANVTASVTFNWAWSKGPLSGSGYGDISLRGGSLDEIFLVRNQESGVPQIVTVSSNVGFEALDLNIHSFSVDWLYQGLLFVFSGNIKHQIEDAVDGALHTDVPIALNQLLNTLPAKISVEGLPFEAVFTYAVYTLNYVMVKGYGEIDTPEAKAAREAGLPWPDSAIAAAGACPFPATPLSASPAQVGGDKAMFSIYLHENILNCITWGLFNAGDLKVVAQDGAIPQVRLITDLFGTLMPDLPKLYHGKGMLLSIAATSPPLIGFSAASGVTISARYDTNVSVVNATGDGSNLLVASLAAELSVVADAAWDATNIKEVKANYEVLSAETTVNTNGWNMIMEWVIKQAGPKQTLHGLWDTYVRTPVTPYFALEGVATTPYEQWFALSSDVKLTQLPGVATAAAAAEAAMATAGDASSKRGQAAAAL